MQFKDLVKDVSKMTDAELMEHVRGIRHNKYVARPAAARRRSDERKKVVKSTTSKVDKIVGKLSAEERAKLLAQLTKG